ncbi:HAMP domain-containing histidine kinase [Ponticoccus sp. SC2-23]|uniref:sensor histidine kinase n=1 Tax=Alexandriicola marinus TaxID=2081710 RepID=UPI000FD7EF94|nr:HAMP domain-containing sensor histidine kinase [Alexandriicola marinus]MBM1219749.1 HAMP domain-containing histidine kinase [Ponticoccus sp. SC6-9]MBM1223179.1 HAMP domain-containing histidine kinase [Ponticoccus sp. SC6-15]MBM1229562.1 HAMP domain-containing histidine kinase [Ponticoccus sp. SC6-38]MBM1232145.1 HAMP domain-containing histidine kinase [Ponticoccus sp. SC6-45]MBM1237905.1 HAMP domain-containing histidine kinase [Ponticoccus sp. SC6-49]MBM1241156.1 HAMP domain-containing his
MSAARTRPRLAVLMTRRLFLIAGIVTAANLLFVALFDASDRDSLVADVAMRELNRIESALTTTLTDPPVVNAADRSIYVNHPQAYGFLVLASDGLRLDAENTELFQQADFRDMTVGNDWVINGSDPDEMLVVAKRVLERSDGDLRVFFIMLDDPANLIDYEVLSEFIGHVWGPLVPIALLLIGGTLLLIRRTIAPVTKAADWANSVVPGQAMPDFDTDDLPAEIADLTEATQRAINRLNMELGSEQRRAAEAAHALRTPIAVLVARADSLPPGPSNDRFREDVRAVSRTVTQLLTSAGADRMQIEEDEIADLTQVVTDVVAELAPFALLHGSEIELSGADAPIRVHGSPDAMKLALTNLIENAVLHGGGTPVHVALDHSAQVTVRDHGPGLPDLAEVRLFEPFCRGPGARSGGAGLGLAIIERIQRAHGGTVEAWNAQGGGAAFCLGYRPV